MHTTTYPTASRIMIITLFPTRNSATAPIKRFYMPMAQRLNYSSKHGELLKKISTTKHVTRGERIGYKLRIMFNTLV